MPFDFVLDELAELTPVVGRMFGCYSIYVGSKIVLILREGKTALEDNGVWIATTKEHHESLARELPSMRSIALFGTSGPTGWQVIPSESDSFEEEVLHVCNLICRGDVRVGKIPKPKKPKKPKTNSATTKKDSTTKTPRGAKKPLPHTARKSVKKIVSAVRKKKK